MLFKVIVLNVRSCLEVCKCVQVWCTAHHHVCLTSDLKESYLSNCQREWCSTPRNHVCVCICQLRLLVINHVGKLFPLPLSLLPFLVYCPSVWLIRAAGRNKKGFLLSLLGDSVHPPLPPTPFILIPLWNSLGQTTVCISIHRCHNDR